MLFKIGKIVDKVVSVISLVSYAGLIIMTLLNVADVIMTKFFIKPIQGAYEITQLVLLCTILASYAYGQTQKTHINMGLVISHLPKVLKYGIAGLTGLLSTGTAVLIGVAACQQAVASMAKNAVTGALFIPWWPFYYISAAAMFVFALVLLYDTVMAFAALGKNEEVQKYVESSWS